jgi:competence protein ComEC
MRPESFRTRRRRRSRLAPQIGIVVLLCLGGVAGWLGFALRRPAVQSFPRNLLAVAVVPVGHGEATWIRTPTGKFVVIGAGPPGSESRLIGSLRAAGCRRIELLVLPYPYSDCVGGTAALAREFPVSAAVDNGWPRVNQHQESARTALAERGAAVKSMRDGDARWVDRVAIRILAPGSELVRRSPAAGNNSLVVQLRYGKTSFLWTGGLERHGEEALLARGPARLRSDWVQVARHGKAGTSSAEFLEAVGAQYVVVASGANQPGLPNQDVVRRLGATGAEVFQTGRASKTTLYLSDGQRVWRDGR